MTWWERIKYYIIFMDWWDGDNKGNNMWNKIKNWFKSKKNK